jgi:hypothetical protein
MYKAQKGAGNPNYKGIMPRCADCGRAVTYPSKSSKQAERCKNCFEIWAKKTNYYSQTAQAIKIAENMRKSKGICPTALKPYLFKKGNVPHNFVGGTCSVKNCTRPFVAKGFCSMHWQHNRKRSNV